MDNQESKINVNINDKASPLVIVELLKVQAHTRALGIRPTKYMFYKGYLVSIFVA